MKSDSSSQDEDILKILKELGSHQVAYPPELLAARRATFLDQVEQRSQVESHEAMISKGTGDRSTSTRSEIRRWGIFCKVTVCQAVCV